MLRLTKADDGHVYAALECDECETRWADANGDEWFRPLTDLLGEARADRWQYDKGHVRCDLHRRPQCDSCGRVARPGERWPRDWMCPSCEAGR